MRSLRKPLSAVVLAAAWLASGSAWAQSTSYRLQLVRAEGAASCPSAALIEQSVAERLGRSPFSEHGERGIEVVVERVEGKWLARLYLRVDQNDAADAVRLLESEAPDCTELGKSVGLAVALAIAPELPPEPAKPPPEPKPAPCPPLPPPPPPPPPSWHGEASLRALLSPNLLPRTSAGLGLSVTFRGELFGAAFGGVFFPESELRVAGAKLGFGVSAAFASGCLWARTADPQVWSCIGSRLGVLHSVVHDPNPVRPGDRLWWAASSELGVRQHLFGRAFIELGAAAVFPLVRYRFEVDAASAPVYQQGPAVAEVFAGLGLRLD